MRSVPSANAKSPPRQLKKKTTHFLIKLLNDGSAGESRLEWGGRLALENENWNMAEKFFSCLLERRRTARDLAGLGQALLQQNRLKEAEECLLSALNCITTPCRLLFIVYKNLGCISLLNKNFETAEEYYNRAYTLNPLCPSLQFQKAYLSFKSGDYKKAESGFKALLQSRPDQTKAWLGLALSRKALKETALAKACLYRVLDLDPKNPKALWLKKEWSKESSESPAPQPSPSFSFSP